MTNIIKYTGAITLLWVFLGGAAYPQIKDTKLSQPIKVSIIHYELDLSIDYSVEKIFGRAGLTIMNISDKPISSVPLLLYRLLAVESVEDENSEPLLFEQKIVSYTDFEKQQVNAITVDLSTKLLPGEEQLLFINYEGHLLGYSEVGYRYIKDHISPDFTIIRNDSKAFPLPGVPSIEINRQSPFPSFTYLARITVPDSLIVANGGSLYNTKSENDRITYTYKSLAPSWRMDFAIARYRQSMEDGIRIFFFPNDSVGASGVKQAAKKSFDLFSRWFGKSGKESMITFIEIPDGWGSQKDVTTIIQSAAAFKDPKRHREVYHEVSHMWDVVPLDRPSPRWSEGLASFLEYLAIEQIEQREIVDSRADLLIRWLKGTVPHNTKWSDTPMISYGTSRLTDLSYSVGALMFDQLYRLIGQDEFNAVIGGYNSKYISTGATTDDFVKYAIETSSFDLTEFFQDWVYTTRWYDRICEAQTVNDLTAYYRKTN